MINNSRRDVGSSKVDNSEAMDMVFSLVTPVDQDEPQVQQLHAQRSRAGL